jgi:hypothetical protein
MLDYINSESNAVKALFPANSVNASGELWSEKIQNKVQEHIDFYNKLQGESLKLKNDNALAKSRFDKDMETFRRIAQRRSVEGWEYAS